MRLRVNHQLSQFWPILARFMDYYSLFWGPGVISTIDEPRGAFTCRSSALVILADSCPFHGLLLYFGVSESFPRLTNPGVRLRVGHQHSHIRPILIRFVHYYSAFWAPRAISTIDEPRGAFICSSSILTVLAKSDLFCGLLLTVFGSRVISTINEPQGAFPCQ